MKTSPIQEAEDALYEESKILADLATQIRKLGFPSVADRILVAHAQIGRDGEPETRLLAALPNLRSAADLLRDAGHLEIAIQIRVSCSHMSRRVDRLQPDTLVDMKAD